jgi:hypothetical protein
VCLNVWSFAYDKVTNLNLSHQNSESVFLFTVMWNTWNKVQTQAISVAAHKSLSPLLHALVIDAKHQKFDLVGQWKWGVQCMKERNFKKYIRAFNNSLLMIWPVLRSYNVPSLAWSSDKLLEVPHQLLFLFNLVIELQIGIVYWYCVNLFEILLPSSSSIAWLKQKTVTWWGNVTIFLTSQSSSKCMRAVKFLLTWATPS